MKKLIFIGSVLLCLTGSTGFAQTGVFNEALLFSRTSFGGTGRMQAIGGAHVSLGGDLSSANVNPAGLGFYNRSDVSLTLGLEFQNADSRFNGNELTSTFDSGIGLDNLGVVFNSTNNGDGKFKGWNFSISVNRINDFNDEVQYSGENNDNSLAFSLANNALGLPDVNLTGLEAAAFETFVINPDVLNDGTIIYDPINLTDIVDINGQSVSFFSFPLQEETISRRGSQQQWSFAAGGNYDDLIYFGGGLGITSINFEQDRVFSESNYFVFGDGVNIFDGNDDALGGLTLRENLSINGVGVNGTFGVIVRPVNFLTFGLSYITPTFHSLNEESSFTLTNVVNSQINTFGGDVINPDVYEFVSDISVSNYNLRTPSRLNLGLTVFTGKLGFITGSVELTDYTTARIRTNDFSEAGDNDAIRDTFTSVANFRLGGEFRWESFRFRAGYSTLRNPLASGFEPVETNNISFGVGYKTKEYYVDLGVVNSSSNRFFSPYSLPAVNSDEANAEPLLFAGDAPLITSDIDQTRVVLTFGLTF